MRQGGEPQGVQIVRQGEPTPYHCDFNPLSIGKKQPALPFSRVQAAFFSAQSALFQLRQCALHFGHLLFQLRQFGFVDFHFQHQARAVADGDEASSFSGSLKGSAWATSAHPTLAEVV